MLGSGSLGPGSADQSQTLVKVLCLCVPTVSTVFFICYLPSRHIEIDEVR